MGHMGDVSRMGEWETCDGRNAMGDMLYMGDMLWETCYGRHAMGDMLWETYERGRHMSVGDM